MRSSELLIATLKETPADAEVISHQLMLRAGLIRKLASGLYTWLPMGLRVLRKIEAIVRDEMNNAGAQEVLMPVVQPAELWEESGRWEQYGAELLRIDDRHNRAFCLGPTHEEVVTDLFRNEVQSYKQLPLNLYQIQTKFRDEIRPRFGVMRAREFIMKDAYSFHIDQNCLGETYNRMHAAYTAIFTRIGLDFRAVLADSGEDDIAFSDSSDYAANVEMAEALAPASSPTTAAALETVATPGVRTIDDVCKQLSLAADTTVKTLLVKAADDCEAELVALVLRGDHQLNEIKAEKLNEVAAPLTMATETEIEAATSASPGSIGPVNLKLPVIVDRAAVLPHFACGANQTGYHYTGANFERDVKDAQIADIRCVVEGDPSPDGHGKLLIKRGIEVGHIFQLGNKYSQALNASVLNESGKSEVVLMGCYGIGVTRVMAAAIEQNHDDGGIIWPAAIAPFQVVLVPINMQKSEAVRRLTESLYQQLLEHNIEVLLDDRNERPGVKFADMELMGIPHRLVIGDKGLERGVIEYRARTSSDNEDVAVDSAVQHLLNLI